MMPDLFPDLSPIPADEEDDSFVLDTEVPTTLIIGAIANEGIVSHLKTQKKQYKQKRLDSRPENWETIAAVFDEFSVEAVLMKLGADALENIANNPNYKAAMALILTRTIQVPYRIFVYGTILEGQAGLWSEVSGKDLYTGLALFDEMHAHVTPYSSNAELSVQALSFISEVGRNVALSLYVRGDSLWSNESVKFIGLFKTFLSRTGIADIRVDESQQGDGRLYEFRSKAGASALTDAFNTFATFMDAAQFNPALASTVLNKLTVNPNDVANLIHQFGKEAKRLSLDILQEREVKMLSIKHRLESELVELVNPGELNQALELADQIFPRPTSLSGLPLGGAIRLASEQPVNLTINNQIIDKVIGSVAQMVSGNQCLSSEMQQMRDLIAEHGSSESSALSLALDQISESGAGPDVKATAKGKLVGFLRALQRKTLDVGVDLLVSYVERQCGLAS